MTDFEKKSLLELRKLSMDELSRYYMDLRRYQFEHEVPLKGIEIRRKIHPLLVSLIKIDRLLAKEKLTVLSDERVSTDRPVIYACTHIGGNDIQRTFEAIKDFAYLFLGDPGEVYRDLTGKLLFLNGAICLETRDKVDRSIAKERAIELLSKGGNLLIYPEGAWNITDNLPVMKLYNGTVRMALETGADIVPVAIEQYDDQFYVNIGQNMKIDNYRDMNVKDITDILRGRLATLKWDIWEKNGQQEREAITPEFKNNFQQSIVDRCGYNFSLQDVYDTMYKDPNETTEEEVFAFRKKLSL